MIMRATQKKMMSGPVTSTLVGKNFASAAGSIVSWAHSHEENQVSRTSESCTQPSPGDSIWHFAFSALLSPAGYQTGMR